MSKHITPSDITAAEIARSHAYGLTHYTEADADKVYAVAAQLDIYSVATEELENSIRVWLDVFAKDWNTIYAAYEVKSAVELGAFMMSNNVAGNLNTKTGGSEMYPLTTWNKWIKEHKAYQKELKARYEYARHDMISQAMNVNWWVA
jgi:hypothetical protein